MITDANTQGAKPTRTEREAAFVSQHAPALMAAILSEPVACQAIQRDSMYQPVYGDFMQQVARTAADGAANLFNLIESRYPNTGDSQ
jgi:hypothetical protein